MRDRDYYPPMSQSQWEEAPFNQSEPPERDFDVVISQTLSKSTVATTTNYRYSEWVEEDEMGKRLEREMDTSDTDWEEAYSESDHYTPLQLIEEFKKYLEIELARAGDTKDKKKLEHLIDECDNWCMDDIEIFEDK